MDLKDKLLTRLGYKYHDRVKTFEEVTDLNTPGQWFKLTWSAKYKRVGSNQNYAIVHNITEAIYVIRYLLVEDK